MTTEYSNWLVDKIADMVAMRKQFLRDNRERHDDDNYEFKRRDKDDKVPNTEEINDQPKEKKTEDKMTFLFLALNMFILNVKLLCLGIIQDLQVLSKVPVFRVYFLFFMV